MRGVKATWLTIPAMCLLLIGCAHTPEQRERMRAVGEALQESTREMNAQTQRNNAQALAVAEANAQRTNDVYRSVIEAPKRPLPVMTTATPYPRPAETNALPTKQQLNTPGIFTGQVKSAADGTQYWEYRRPDGSIYWAPPGSGGD